jgi:Ni,Fe-hydrogenase III small subunit
VATICKYLINKEMFKELKILSHHGIQYIKDLRTQPVSEFFRGRPVIAGNVSESEIHSLHTICPAGAINKSDGAIDLGKCVFCKECSFLLPEKVRFLNDYRIAVNRREDLIIKPGNDKPVRLDVNSIRKDIRKLFRGALKLRQVSAGGDNSCEMELNATNNVNFDFGRYGVEFVASPRHADGIVITGPVADNMADALDICYAAVPEPKIVILVGTDAISGSVFSDLPAINRRFIDEHNIDLFVPGNPAHPLTFINGVMDLVGIE